MIVVDSSFEIGTHLSGRAWLARWLVIVAHGIQRLADAACVGAASRSSVPAELEFYCDAGAPEGALYVRGELVGLLHGVARL